MSKGQIQFLKLTFGSITGWWKCFRCGCQFPGQYNPDNHSCDVFLKLKKGSKAVRKKGAK